MMQKKVWMIMAITFMVLTMTSRSVHAGGNSGVFTDGGTWSLDENRVMTISGKAHVDIGELDDAFLQTPAVKVIYGPEVAFIDGGLFSYCETLEDYEVDPDNPGYVSMDGVIYDKELTTVIACPEMKEGHLTLPDSVTVIGEDAFVNAHLSSIDLPDGLTTISSQAFFDCHLTEITFPASLWEFSLNSFCECHQLENITVDPGNQHFISMDGVMFSPEKETLILFPGARTGEYVVPAGVLTIESGAFSSADELTSVTLPESMRHIRSAAFSGSGIETITIPEKLTDIGTGAFHNCRDLRTINYTGTRDRWNRIKIETENEPLQFCVIHCSDGDLTPDVISGKIGFGGKGTVRYEQTPDGFLTVEGAGEWDYYCFSNNNFIIEAVLEPGVTEIGPGAFMHASNLKNVTIPDTVTKICADAFYGCNSLETVTIPSSVVSIGEDAFIYMERLAEINYGGTIAEWQAMTEGIDAYNARQAFVRCSDGDIKYELDHPEAGGLGENASYYVETYDEDESAILYIEGSGDIPAHSFEGWNGLDGVVVLSEIVSIGDYAFADMEDLSFVALPDTLTEIGTGAFAGDDALSSVEFYGTHEQWDTVNIGDNNEDLQNAYLECFEE